MEALGGAGIPVYATRGGHGGWELSKAYRTSLTGLTATDVVAIVVGRPPRVLSDLGLADPGETPLLKLMESITPTARQEAEHARRRIHVDLGSWNGEAPAILPLLQQAIWADRMITMRYRESRSSFPVAPLGLVSKGGAWYLVAQRDGVCRTYHVARINDVSVGDAVFERPADFELARYWREAEGSFGAKLPRYVVKLRLRGDALARAGWTWAKAKAVSVPDDDGWADAELDLQDEETALRTVRLLGNDVVVRAPGRLRRLAVAEARAFVTANGGETT